MALLWYQRLEMMVLYMGKATRFVSQNRIIIMYFETLHVEFYRFGMCDA